MSNSWYELEEFSLVSGDIKWIIISIQYYDDSIEYRLKRIKGNQHLNEELGSKMLVTQFIIDLLKENKRLRRKADSYKEVLKDLKNEKITL